MFSTLADAIALSRKAIQDGREIFVFPPDLNPSEFFSNFDQYNASWLNYDRKVTSINAGKHSARRTNPKGIVYRH